MFVCIRSTNAIRLCLGNCHGKMAYHSFYRPVALARQYKIDSYPGRRRYHYGKMYLLSHIQAGALDCLILQLTHLRLNIQVSCKHQTNIATHLDSTHRIRIPYTHFFSI